MIDIIEKENCTINYGDHLIDFSLEYGDRKTLEITVKSDQQVYVKAPFDQDFDKIKTRVEKRAKWILKQQDFFESFIPREVPRKYISGETHRYLGKQYRIKIIKSEEETVKLKGRYIYIFTSNKSNKDQVKNLLEYWYLEHAKVKFMEKLSACHLKARKYGIIIPKLHIRKMSKRWGSYTKDGKIILNFDLIKAPSYCIEYVIMHELCHSKYFSHNRQFFGLLSILMSDWNERKKRLEQILL